MTFRQRLGALIAKTFRLGPAVVERADVAFGTDPEKWMPESYGAYIATSSAVYACVNLRARNLASLPITLYKQGAYVESGAAYDLLNYVNPYWTPNRLWQMTCMALDLWGQAFWVLERGASGTERPKEIWYARPDKMRIIPDEKNYIAGYVYEWNNQRLAFKTDEVIWFRYPNPIDEFAGLSPIAATRLALDTGHAALKSNNAVFSNGVQLAGVVTPSDKDQTWARDQVEALRDMLDRRFRGVDKAHRLAVLGQSATFTPMSISPRDAQFIELMKWTRSDACMVYGVPPELIGDQEGATYNNVRQAHTGFWTDTMIPLAALIAGEITEQFLPMFGNEADKAAFDTANVAALQADMRETAEQAKIWASIGVPLNRILEELAPQFLDHGAPYPWGNSPIGQATATGTAKSIKSIGIDLTPPMNVREELRRGLALYEAGKGGSGLMPQTISEARDMANGAEATPDKIRRMVAWFARHESDMRPGWDKPGQETPGFVAWLLWGGDPGRAWAIRMAARLADAQVADKAFDPIVYGSAEHKAAYEEFGRRADRIMASFKRRLIETMTAQGAIIAEELAAKAKKAIYDDSDLEEIWMLVDWNEIFADALLYQIQGAAELGAVSTLGDLKVSTALFNLDSPEVSAAMTARAQAFAEPVNETTWHELKTRLMEGINNGAGIDKLQEIVVEVMQDRIKSNAETIARTETIGALTEGSLMGAQLATQTGLIVKKQWLATFDGRERLSHADAHKFYQENPIELSASFSVGGVAFKSPGNPTAGRTKESAPESINCRCSMTYVTGGDAPQRRVLSSTVADIMRWLDASN